MYPENGTTSLAQVNLLFAENENGDITVSSPSIKLKKLTVFRFVVIFYWDNLSYAYVDTTQATGNEATDQIIFSESLIIYEAFPNNPAVSASISEGILPNLDSDGDGYSNFIEIRSGSNPNNAASMPSGPVTSNFKAVISDDGNSMTITADILDGQGISEVNLSFPEADYLQNAVVQSLSGDEKSKTRTFTATLNPHYAPVGILSITLTSKNILGLTSSTSIDINIIDDGVNAGPFIDVETLQENQTVAGTVLLSIKAYDRNDIASIEVLNPSGLVNQATVPDRFVATWETTTVPDSPITLRIIATDEAGATETKTLNLIVSNGTDASGPFISLDVYQSSDLTNPINYKVGKLVFGKITINALATDPSGVSRLTLLDYESLGEALGTPSIDSPTVYVNTLNTTLLAEGSVVRFTFLATDHLDHTSISSFSMVVVNQPVVSNFTVDAAPSKTIASGTQVSFGWDTSDVGIRTITQVSTGNTLLMGIVAKGSSLQTITQSGIYRLTITNATNMGTYTATQDVTIHVDDDGDGLDNETDNCDTISGLDQTDTDHDEVGDLCDPDMDGDGINNETDNCDYVASSSQNDSDHDGLGDICDNDADGDGHLIEDDCDDADPTRYKGFTLYTDLDGDNYAVNDAQILCLGSTDIPTGYSVSTLGEDCDDNNENIHPGIPEILNGTDDNCDALLDNIELLTTDLAFFGTQGYTPSIDGELAGYSIQAAGDFNGDGLADIVIGAPSYDAGFGNEGRVYIVYGKRNLRSLNLEDADVIFNNIIGAYTGFSVAGVGDVNNDGADDILIGTYSLDLFTSTYSGKTYLVFGLKGEAQWTGNHNLVFDSSDSILPLESIETIFYHLDPSTLSFAGAGDINNDGYDDIVMGIPNYASNDGKTYIIYGRPNIQWAASGIGINITLYGETGLTSKSGFAVAGAGDVNRDGYDDFLIGAPEYSVGGEKAGKTYLIYGTPNPQPWAKPQMTLTLDNLGNRGVSFAETNLQSNYSGSSVSGIGDMNNDGYDDFAIGAYQYPDGASDGITHIFYGKASFNQNNPLNTHNAAFLGDVGLHTESGKTLAGPALISGNRRGDINGDGYDDFLIGAPSYSEPGLNFTGKTYLVHGTHDKYTGLIDLSAENISQFKGSDSDMSGYSLTIIGDMNGDNKPEIAVGAPWNDFGDYNAGAVYIIPNQF